MILFDRIVLGFIGLGTAALFGIAASLPFNWSTHSPEAVLISPENIVASVNFDANHQQLITASSLSKAFSKINYDFNVIQAGQESVPRLFVKKLPIDMRRIKATEQKKKLFFFQVL